MKIFKIGCAVVFAFLLFSCSNKNDAPLETFSSPLISQLPPGVTPVNPPITPAGQTSAVPVKGMLAIHSIAIDQKANINSDIAVIGTCSGATCVANNAELSVDQQATLAAVNAVKADTITIKQKANVPSRLEAREYAVDKKASAPNRNVLGTLPELPVFLAGTPGTQNISVSGTQSLSPGNYDKISVSQKSNLNLTGGFYQVSEVEIGQKATLECAVNAVCVLLVKGKFTVDQKSIVRAASTNANDLLVYVEGTSASNQAAVKIGQKAYVNANIYAANGTLDIGQKVEAQGVFIGKWIKIGQKAHIVGSGAPTNAVVKLFEAGIVGVIEIPGKVKLEVPANALAEDTVISVTNRGPITADKPRSPAQLRFVGEAFEFQPDGLQFSANYTLTMNYDPAQVAAIGVTPSNLMILGAPRNSVAFGPMPSPNLSEPGLISINGNHFTIFSVGSLGVNASISDMSAKGDAVYALEGGYFLDLATYDIANKIAPSFQKNLPGAGTISTGYNGLRFFRDKLWFNGRGDSYSRPTLFCFELPAVTNCPGYPDQSDSVVFGNAQTATDFVADFTFAKNGGQDFYVSVETAQSANGGVYRQMEPAPSVKLIHNGWNISNTFGASLGILLVHGADAFTRIDSFPFGVLRSQNFFNQAGVTSHLLTQFVTRMESVGSRILYGAWQNGQPTVRAFDPATGNVYYHATGTAETTYDIVVTGNVVYALQAGSTGRITELDMTDPTSPQPPLSSIPVAPDTFHMTQSGNYLVVAEGTFSTPTLRLINIGFRVRGVATGVTGPVGTIEMVNSATSGQPVKTYINSNGSYQLAELIADGNAYNITIPIQPPGYLCTVANAMGVMDFQNPPNNVNVSCAAAPPIVVSTSPSDAASFVSILAPISVTFSEPMNSGTLTTTTSATCVGSVQVSNNNFATCVPMASSAPIISNGGTTATFTPISLIWKSTYKIRVTTAARDSGGQFMAANYEQAMGFFTNMPMVTTYAGTGSQGSTNGPALSATFWYPSGVAVDSQGNVFIADQTNHLIRKINPLGQVSTIAGSGLQGAADGLNTGSAFRYPTGIAVDRFDNIFVADYGNDKIRKLTVINPLLDYMVETYAGCQNQVNPCNASSSLDHTNPHLATIPFPNSLVIDPLGNAFVLEQYSHSLRKISLFPGANPTRAGAVNTLIGPDTLSQTNQLQQAAGIALDPYGNLFVADSGNNVIRKITPAGVMTIFAGCASLPCPRGYINGHVSVAQFDYPIGIAVDSGGNVFVGDYRNCVIRKIAPSNIVTTYAGSGACGSIDGPASAATFYGLNALALDQAGNLYVADSENNKIRKIQQ